MPWTAPPCVCPATIERVDLVPGVVHRVVGEDLHAPVSGSTSTVATWTPAAQVTLSGLRVARGVEARLAEVAHDVGPIGER